jgi:hypothetical protein
MGKRPAPSKRSNVRLNKVDLGYIPLFIHNLKAVFPGKGSGLNCYLPDKFIAVQFSLAFKYAVTP